MAGSSTSNHHGLTMLLPTADQLDRLIEPILSAARIPGAALAVASSDGAVIARAYGNRDLQTGAPVTASTLYPIASTTKAMTATLLGMLVDQCLLEWDAPVQKYLPRFRLQDPTISMQVTLRDLLTMRIGLPAHDFMRIENPLSRADLVECLPYLTLSAGLRERFQYSDLSYAIAGHVAEIVAERSWEELIRDRILEPLGMTGAQFEWPVRGEVTQSYHENQQRQLLPTQRWQRGPLGPAGSSLYSSVQEMMRWLSFNLNGGSFEGRQLLSERTFVEIRSPQMLLGMEQSLLFTGGTDAAYALGWFLGSYQGFRRIFHTGYLPDVNSDLTLFPAAGVGLVSFTNFAGPRLASFINERVFDLMAGATSVHTIEQKLTQYEEKVASNRRRIMATPRIDSTTPSQPLDAYVGIYRDSGYGQIEIRRDGEALCLARNALMVPLQHWHYDVWAAVETELFEIHRPHPLEHRSRIVFETSADGHIVALSMRLEPAVPPIRFRKQ